MKQIMLFPLFSAQPNLRIVQYNKSGSWGEGEVIIAQKLVKNVFA